TTRISADSVGRGWAVPAEMMGPALMAAVNELAGKLGYAPVDEDWGIAAVPPDVRLPGTSTTAIGATAPGTITIVAMTTGAAPGAATSAGAASAASAGTAAVTSAGTAAATSAGTAAVTPAGTAATGSGAAAPGLRMMAARLLSGLARLDERFAALWSPCSGEVFLVTVTAPGGGAVAARWRVDLAAPGITSASGLAPGETGGAQWDII